MSTFYCNKRSCARNPLKKVYRINLFFRDPDNKYTGSGLTVVHSENRQYCKKHYKEILSMLARTLAR